MFESVGISTSLNKSVISGTAEMNFLQKDLVVGNHIHVSWFLMVKYEESKA